MWCGQDVGCGHGYVVGADVFGGPRVLLASTMASPWARRAEDVAPYHVVRTGRGVWTWVRAW